MNRKRMRALTGLALFLVVISALSWMAGAQKTADDWVKMGDDLLLSKKDSGTEAMDAYERALELDPQNESILLREATICQGLSEYAAMKALGIVEKKLENDPGDALAWRLKGGALYLLDMKQEANQSVERSIEILDLEIEKNPENGTAWWYRAESLVSLFKFEEAIIAYEKVIELDRSREVDAWMGKGNSLMLLERPDEAVAAYDKAIELDPTNVVAWFSKGRVLDFMGNSEDAKKAYAKADELREQ